MSAVQHTIVVKQRPNDYHACIDGDETRWDCGNTITAAIGALVLGRQAEFGIRVLNDAGALIAWTKGEPIK